MNSIVERDPGTGRSIARDLLQERFGQLRIIARCDGQKCNNGYQMWRARCDCGQEIERPSYRFVRSNGRTPILSCPGCAPKGRPRIPGQGAHINMAYAKYKKGAQERGIAFDLTKDELRALIAQDCHYCGTPAPVRPTHPNLSGDFNWNGIDRQDSAGVYNAENCVPCCGICNRAKMDMPLIQFLDWAKRLGEHQSRSRPLSGM